MNEQDNAQVLYEQSPRFPEKELTVGAKAKNNIESGDRIETTGVNTDHRKQRIIQNLPIVGKATKRNSNPPQFTFENELMENPG